MQSIIIVINIYINKQNRINLPSYTFNLDGNLGVKRQDFFESSDP